MTEDEQPISVPTDSEPDGIVQNGSEPGGTNRKGSELFRDVPNGAERKRSHTLTVREVARMFESAGVARTERCIVKWCAPNSQGVAKLDCYLDPNERKYFITPQSVELAIAEEKAKAARSDTVSGPAESVPNGAENGSSGANREPEPALERTAALEKQVMDLKILHSGKDYLIQQLRQERDGFFNQLLDASREVGQLETRLLQLAGPELNESGSSTRNGHVGNGDISMENKLESSEHE